MSKPFAFAEFQVINAHLPQAQMRLGRRYILTVETIVTNNNYRLTYAYGGNQRHISMIPVWCTDYDELLAIIRQKIKQRIRHGYSLIDLSPNFPLHNWLHDQGYIQQSSGHFRTPAMQLFLPYFSL